MDRTHSLFSGKSGSFSVRRDHKKVCEPSRHLSMNGIKMTGEKKDEHHQQPKIEEEDEDEAAAAAAEEVEKPKEEGDQAEEENGDKKMKKKDLATISDEIDVFLSTIEKTISAQNQIENATDLPEIPESAIDELAALVEKEVARMDSSFPLSCQDKGEFSLLNAIDRISKLTTALGAFPSESTYAHAMNRTATVLQRAMAFLEEEFRSLLEDNKSNDSNSCKWTPPTPPPANDSDHVKGSGANSLTPTTVSDPGTSTSVATELESPPLYPPETVERLRMIAGTMIMAGYETECCQVFSIARRTALGAGLAELGFQKTGAEELQKMAWEALEGEIATWITAFRQSVSVSFCRERDLCEAVFSGHPAVSAGFFSNLARSVIIQLLNFAEAVAMTKRSGEKLFKFLDMYETMRDLIPVTDSLFPASGEEEQEDGSLPSSLLQAELKSEMSVTKSRLGEAVVGMFSDLENSIKSDNGKTPVPGGAVHPLTRYVMNYLKYACEYKNTLNQVFEEHHKQEGGSEEDNSGDGHKQSAFAAQLMVIMDLLDGNLDAKSKLYKDQSLSYIFLMNNGRYIVQKIKGWSDINELLGDTWCRKRSSDLRQYHKNYQRETWGRVLGCFKEDGLHLKGAVSKPVLKERFKSFNAIFEEIHKTQSCWVVSDEQLQSELRVSVSAVVVPAYRSFLGRYRQYLDSGRQSEKYIKYAAEDLESYIDELFDGNPSSLVRRRT